MSQVSLREEHEHRLSDVATMQVIMILHGFTVSLANLGQEVNQLVCV